jgi:hypothetical protein
MNSRAIELALKKQRLQISTPARDPAARTVSKEKAAEPDGSTAFGVLVVMGGLEPSTYGL